MAVGKRRPLSVESTELRVKSLADDLAIAYDDRAHQGIRANPPASALSKLKRPAQMGSIRGCDLAAHRTD